MIEGAINRIAHDAVHALMGRSPLNMVLAYCGRGEAARYKSAVELKLMQAIKRALDPQGIMESGKDFGRLRMRVCAYWALAPSVAGWASSWRGLAAHRETFWRAAPHVGGIRADGLLLTLIRAGETLAVKVAASDDPAELVLEHFPDLLIVAVKSQGLRATQAWRRTR